MFGRAAMGEIFAPAAPLRGSSRLRPIACRSCLRVGAATLLPLRASCSNTACSSVFSSTDLPPQERRLLVLVEGAGKLVTDTRRD